MTYTYTATTEPAQGLNLDTVRLVEGHAGIVKRSDGTIVWRSGIYRLKKSAQLQANRMKPRYIGHLERHGACFYDQERAKKATWKEWADAKRGLINSLQVAAARGIGNATNPGSERAVPKPEWVEGSPERQIYEIARAHALATLPPEPPRA
jgi:hypothetical protein